MRRALAAWLLAACAAAAGPARTWTDRSGKSFEAELIATDTLRVTLAVKGGAKSIVPVASLSSADVEFLRGWRRENPYAPIVDVSFLPPWPREAVAESFDVRITAEDRVTGSTHYASPHFAIASSLRLPVGVVRDLAAVLEATRAAVCAAPLGLQPGFEPAKYRVRLFANAEEYGEAGGGTGTGGTYTHGEMLILLPNLGIQPTSNGLSAEHNRNLFVIKHEVTHQLIAPWRRAMPPWLDEGLAETFAAMPYTRGRYTFQNLDSAMRDYLLKWRGSRDARTLRLIAPGKLMALDRGAWTAEVSAGRAYDLYNSSGLLVHWLLHRDGRGDGAGVAAYFNALREGVPAAEAEQKHLLRGRSGDQIAAELKTFARRMALEIAMDQ